MCLHNARILFFKPFIDPTIDGVPLVHMPTYESNDKPCFLGYAVIIFKMSRPFVVVGNFLQHRNWLTITTSSMKLIKCNQLCMVTGIS